MIKENRLIGYRAEDFTAQKKVAAANLAAAGGTSRTPVQPLSGGTIAQTNAATQAANYQNTLANNPNLSTAQQTYQTYIDPATGKDSRAFTQDYTVTDPVTGLKTTYSGGTPIAGSGTLSTQETHRVLGSPSVQNPNQGTSIVGDRVTTVPLGQTAGAGGQAGAPGFNPSAVTAGDNTLNFDAQMADLKAKKEDAFRRGNSSGLDVNGNRTGEVTGQAARDELTYLQQQEDELKRKKAEQDQKAADLAAKKAQEQQTNLEQAYKTDPAATGMAAALANLPPEQQWLAPFIQNTLDQLTQSQTENASTTQAMISGGTVMVNGQPVQVPGIQNTYDKADKELADLKAGYTSMQTGIQDMLDTAKVQQDKYIAKQEAAAEERLALNKQNDLRTAADNKREAIESRIARLALTGGIGSSGGNAEIVGAKVEYDKQMQNIREEYGVQSLELTTKFTGLYLQSNEDYTTKSINNIKDTTTALERIAGQKMASTEARGTSMNTILGNFMTQQATNRKELAATIKDYATQIQTGINQKRDDERADTQNAMASLLTLRGQGVQNLSGNALKYFQDKLPGIDVAAIIKDPTNASMKAAQDKANDINTSSSSFANPEQASIMDAANLAGDGMSVTAGGIFRNEVAKKLRAGKTEEAKSYVYTQIANSLKGTAATEYDARSNQVIQIGDILKQMKDNPNFKYDAVEYWKQKGLSLIGKASPEYYSLMAPIAQVSADITHGLSGAAVSPSEWSRLQKFMPQTGEGKGVLEVKLDGLLKYATWMNQAKIARAANMPVPPDPTLSPSEQKAQENVPREDYTPSNEGINDILHPAGGKPLSYVNNFRVTQDYGSTWDQEQGIMNGPHLALDLAPKVKGELTYVPALRGGTVTKVVRGNTGLGNYVEVQDENGDTFIYGHLASIAARVGDRVEDDTALGQMGSTGLSTGTHLHLAVKNPEGKYVDPRDFLT